MALRKFPELTYASPNDPRLKRWLIHTIEGLSGRSKFLPLYKYWKKNIVGHRDRVMGELLALIDCDLKIDSAEPWPIAVPAEVPLVIVANHPFGIGDGIAILALAEQLGRPFKVLINNQLLRVPEIRPYSLPIDFEETKEAMATNLATRKEALRLLATGTTVVVFPAGGVATARSPFGKAVDLPWKLFTAKLIQSARASVLPVYFEGQNGPLFHIASRLSLTLRLSLLVSEFRRFAGSSVTVRIGRLIPFAELGHNGDRKLMTEELHRLVHGLAKDAPPPGARARLKRVGGKAKRHVKGVGRLAKMKARRVGSMARTRIRARRRSDGGDGHTSVSV
ncbi:MAG: 1-acyl-sn-glycerol-3-phosphate acyltransferase [Hyphomicrobiaceae bacterium]